MGTRTGCKIRLDMRLVGSCRVSIPGWTPTENEVPPLPFNLVQATASTNDLQRAAKLH